MFRVVWKVSQNISIPFYNHTEYKWAQTFTDATKMQNMQRHSWNIKVTWQLLLGSCLIRYIIYDVFHRLMSRKVLFYYRWSYFYNNLLSYLWHFKIIGVSHPVLSILFSGGIKEMLLCSTMLKHDIWFPKWFVSWIKWYEVLNKMYVPFNNINL